MDVVLTAMSGVGCFDEAGRWRSGRLYWSVRTVAWQAVRFVCYGSTYLLAAPSFYAGGLRLFSLKLWFY